MYNKQNNVSCGEDKRDLCWGTQEVCGEESMTNGRPTILSVRQHMKEPCLRKTYRNFPWNVRLFAPSCCDILYNRKQSSFPWTGHRQYSFGGGRLQEWKSGVAQHTDTPTWSPGLNPIYARLLPHADLFDVSFHVEQ